MGDKEQKTPEIIPVEAEMVGVDSDLLDDGTTKSDFSQKNIVAQANLLVQKSNGVLNGTSLKLFKAFVSCVDTKERKLDRKEDRIVKMTKAEIREFFNDKHANYTYFKQQMYELKSKTTIIIQDGTTRVVSYVDEISWNDKDPYVTCVFSEAIMPYLVGLKEFFLQYPINNIRGFKSKYSTILYEYILSIARQKYTKDVIISIEDLRNITGVNIYDLTGKKIKEKYGKFKDLEQYVISPAVKEINENKEIEYIITSYDKIKKGKAIHEIEFHLKMRTSKDDTVEYTRFPEIARRKI